MFVYKSDTAWSFQISWQALRQQKANTFYRERGAKQLTQHSSTFWQRSQKYSTFHFQEFKQKCKQTWASVSEEKQIWNSEKPKISQGLVGLSSRGGEQVLSQVSDSLWGGSWGDKVYFSAKQLLANQCFAVAQALINYLPKSLIFLPRVSGLFGAMLCPSARRRSLTSSLRTGELCGDFSSTWIISTELIPLHQVFHHFPDSFSTLFPRQYPKSCPRIMAGPHSQLMTSQSWDSWTPTQARQLWEHPRWSSGSITPNLLSSHPLIPQNSRIILRTMYPRCYLCLPHLTTKPCPNLHLQVQLLLNPPTQALPSRHCPIPAAGINQFKW